MLLNLSPLSRTNFIGVIGAVTDGIYEVDDDVDVEVIVACVDQGVAHVLVDDDLVWVTTLQSIKDQTMKFTFNSHRK